MNRNLFVQHLEQLRSATDHTQPLADLRGNLDALHALVTLQAAAQQILTDISTLLSEAK